MDYQQPHGYMGLPPSAPAPPPPPPPHTSDPYHHQQHQLPVPPPPNPWYSTQFQYQHSSSTPPLPPPPSYPPPPHQPWAPPPPQNHSDHFASVPQPPPYPASSPYFSQYPVPPHNQYPPPPHQLPLPPRPHGLPPHQIPQTYSQVSQDWGNANWGQHQSWEYQANTNEEVWAAKARAWAAAKVASDGQQTPYLYAVKDGNVPGDSTAVFSGQDSSLSPLVHQQEVPSSYSSIAGDSVRGVDPAVIMPSDYAFLAPAEPAVAYSSVPAVTALLPQVDPSVALSSPVPGPSATMFGRMPAPSFQATVSSITPSYGVGPGPELHPITTFSGDAFGVPGVPERPKKAAVPNWLREEIIKKKPVLLSSAAEPPNEDDLSIEDEGVDTSYRKIDQADSKSADSSGSTDEEEDGEDEVEAARTVAVNQEIKRVLTEVLLKVTDELFDEIATKVLTEEDPSAEADSAATASDHKATTVFPTANGSATVVAPAKTKETLSSNTSEKPSPSFSGDLLGLGSYESDDDDELPSSDKLIFNGNNIQQHIVNNSSKGTNTASNDNFPDETIKKHDITIVSDPDSSSAKDPIIKHSAPVSLSVEDMDSKESVARDSELGTKMKLRASDSVVHEVKLQHEALSAKPVVKAEKSVGDITSQKSSINDTLDKEKRTKSDKNHRQEVQRNSLGYDHKLKELKMEESVSERGYKSQVRHGEWQDKKDRRHDQKGSKDRLEEKSVRPEEKAKDPDSRRRSPHDYSKESEKHKDVERRARNKDDGGRRRERTRDVKADDSNRTNGSHSSRRRRRRSRSVASRDRENDGSVGSQASDLSSESSDYSKRKLYSKRQKSPSPTTVRSRKRQVSRSPSKHSQLRHSSYSSLEAARKRRSRSRSRSRSSIHRRR